MCVSLFIVISSFKRCLVCQRCFVSDWWCQEKFFLSFSRLLFYWCPSRLSIHYSSSGIFVFVCVSLTMMFECKLHIFFIVIIMSWDRALKSNMHHQSNRLLTDKVRAADFCTRLLFCSFFGPQFDFSHCPLNMLILRETNHDSQWHKNNTWKWSKRRLEVECLSSRPSHQLQGYCREEEYFFLWCPRLWTPINMSCTERD